MRRTLAAAALLLPAIQSPAAGAGQPAARAFRDQARGIEFRYPARWLATPCPAVSDGAGPGRRDPDCVAVYRRKADVDSDRYVATLTFSHATLEEALQKAGLHKREGAWFMPDNFQGGEAEPLEGPGWKGIRVSTICGVMDEAGGYHAAAGECFTAVLSSDRRSVTVSSVHSGLGPPPGGAVEAIIDSIRFTPAPAR